jgi:predicted permease
MGDRAGRFLRRLGVLWRWRSHEAELREEIAWHTAMRRAEFERQGLAPDAAAAAANRAMGNATAVRETSRGIWLGRWLESVWQDLAFGLRSMRRNVGFTLTVVGGLGAGLGCCAAAFSTYNAFVMRGWAVREPERLVALFATTDGGPRDRRSAGFSLAQMDAFVTRSQLLDGAIAYERWRPDGTGSITVSPVSGSYFAVLGVPMLRGRAFDASEDRIGAPVPVIVLSEAYWRTRLASAPEVVGSTVRVRGLPFVVIGVAARGFDGTDLSQVDAWIPLAALPLVRPTEQVARTALADRDACCVHVAARLAPGATAQGVAEELTAILASVARPGIDTLPRRVRANAFTLVGSAGPNVVDEITPIFLMLGAGTALVLLLACANVGNLLLARAAVRQREITTRLALGASRARIVRQLMTESLLLSLLAGVPALLLASWLPPRIVAVLTRDALALTFPADMRVGLVTVTLAVLSCLMFGLAPAIAATRRLTESRVRVPLRSLFLTAQVALSCALLVAAALFLRSARQERVVALGYEYDAVRELRLDPPADQVDSVVAARIATTLPQLVEAAGLPYAFTSAPPFGSGGAHLKGAGAEHPNVPLRHASSGYFAVLSIPLLAGRRYRDGGAREVVVNAALAATLGGVSTAVGSTVAIDSVPYEVVGVVGDARDLRTRDVAIAAYAPLEWHQMPQILVRASAEETRALRQVIADAEPSLEVSWRDYRWYVDRALAGSITGAILAGGLGLLALALASIGMFGVFSYWVRQQRRDIGIRMALGASPNRVVRMVLRKSAEAVGWGLVAGIGLALVAAFVIRSSLYGVSALDPIAFVGTTGLLVLAALVATLIPARRAAQVDPAESLRSD